MDGNFCWWVYKPTRCARTDCGKLLYLEDSIHEQEDKCLDIYQGKRCSGCGKKILVTKDSYYALKK